MHFAIDIREVCREQRTGKGQWTYGFVNELLSRGHDVTLLSDAAPSAHWQQLATAVALFPPGWFWHIRAALFLRKSTRIHAYISPTSYIVPCILGRSVPTVPVVHDLIAFQQEPHNAKAKYIERCTLRYCLRSAAVVLAVSTTTKQDILERFSFVQASSVFVIYAGPLRKAVTVHTPSSPVIFCPATLCPRKNQKRLVQAYAALPEQLRKKYSLLFVGARGWQDQNIVKEITKTPGAEWKNYVPDATYEQLLNNCTILALPSLYEGFGMQILDALQRGIPILTSNKGSLHEVAGEAAVFADPESVESITNGLIQLLDSATLRQGLREAGPKQAQKFTWKTCIDTFEKAMQNMSL